MSNQKHTPGPWELSECNTSIWGISPMNARVRLANIQKHSPMNGIDWEANARLIAAAPDMLEALKRIANGDGYYGAQAREYKEIASAAVAKAEGR